MVKVVWKTHLQKVSNDGKTGRTRKRDRVSGAAEQAVEEPENSEEELASSVKCAQQHSREGNGSRRMKDAESSGVIDEIRGDLGLGQSHGRIEDGAHFDECEGRVGILVIRRMLSFYVLKKRCQEPTLWSILWHHFCLEARNAQLFPSVESTWAPKHMADTLLAGKSYEGGALGVQSQ